MDTAGTALARAGGSMRTRAVHAGQGPEAVTGALATPIFQTTSFAYGSFARGAEIFQGVTGGYLYTRFANPTVAALEDKIADLEGAEAAVATSSGMAATAAVVSGLLSPGDELLFVGPLYGGTEALFASSCPASASPPSAPVIVTGLRTV